MSPGVIADPIDEAAVWKPMTRSATSGDVRSAVVRTSSGYMGAAATPNSRTAAMAGIGISTFTSTAATSRRPTASAITFQAPIRSAREPKATRPTTSVSQYPDAMPPATAVETPSPVRNVKAQIATADSIPFWTATMAMPRTASVPHTPTVRCDSATGAFTGASQRRQVTVNVIATANCSPMTITYDQRQLSPDTITAC